MQEIYADLHIHIGRAGERPVKITASPQLTLENIIFKTAPLKGLHMVAVVDAGSLAVSQEIEILLEGGKLREIPQGGLLADNGVVLILASECECREGVHLISYLPDLISLKDWQKHLQSRVTNLTLSTQRVDMGFIDILYLCRDLDGIFCPAHVFTPHKGTYGAWTDRLRPRLSQAFELVRVIELGLSADTYMADLLKETAHFSLLSNSDAHSLPNIGREFNLLQVPEKSFADLKNCLKGNGESRIIANYGLDPRMGKYHRSYCPDCDHITDATAPVRACCICGSSNIVMGVYDRIMEIKDDQPCPPEVRPHYHYRVPLSQIPGVGIKTYQKLLSTGSSEIEILEKMPGGEIALLAGQDIADTILAMRMGRLDIDAGGGGKYGKVKKNHRRH
ncbi:Polymerase/histidinol phosphatase-like [Syntrophomonas zehnderi OL-4]|uniref:Polymerase/histidinol phosphatase-like n=1 Tax=Syntrophomonas zehnderi OL-4 TaxID=690567 RepID=A0A0E4GDL5_9FIRM|nr:endonuclease Q family protein [Syntrophomonas zehnderi]CFX50686.1 Polymerase/histidinol phosphatase-like [Syntrophomonas zehnderi OL-4]